VLFTTGRHRWGRPYRPVGRLDAGLHRAMKDGPASQRSRRAGFAICSAAGRLEPRMAERSIRSLHRQRSGGRPRRGRQVAAGKRGRKEINSRRGALDKKWRAA
jgi:hypothetical protein